jgi:hypothetical protein
MMPTPKPTTLSKKFLDISLSKFTNEYDQCDKLVIFQVDKIIEKKLDDGNCNYFCRGSLYTKDDLRSLGLAIFKCNNMSDYCQGDKLIVKIICKDEQGFFVVTPSIEFDELLKFTYEYI